jgi:hypothetical protein
MSSFQNEPRSARIWFDDDNLWLELIDGRQLSVPLAYFPRLLHASPEQRERYEVSGGGTGLHWEEVDEDISVAGLLAGVGDRTKSRIAAVT